ncbi:MAG: hypothetical protein Q7J73_04755, partial [Dehalococcoidales bacterium]|nr:hypothetical protein [Dehalococcoidales bacterium]
MQKLRVQLDAAPGTGKSYVITFRKELADTALTCTVSDLATSCSDLTHTATIVAGDRLDLSVTPSGTPAAARVSFILEFVPTTSGETVLMGVSGGNFAAGTNYASFTGGAVGASEGSVYVVIPTSGTLKNLYTRLSAAPGTSNSRIFTVRKNSADTGLTMTFGATDSGVLSDTSDTVTVSAGDLITLGETVTGTPTAASGAWGVTFVPDSSGDFIIPALTNATVSASVVNYMGLAGFTTASSTETNSVQTLGWSDYTMTAVYVKLISAPGSGKSYATALRENAGNPSNTFAVSISGTTASSSSLTGQSFTPTDGALYDTSITPSGTPTAGRVFVSYAGHTASDVTPPVISAIASSTTSNSATITWTTDEAATSTVNYGATSGYGTASTSASLVTSHSITITGLTASTLYHFQAASADGSGNVAASSDNTFTTPAVDSTSPVPGNSGTITTASVAARSLTLNWTKGTDNVSAQGNLQYEVRQSTSNNVDTVSNAEANGSIIQAYTADINTFNVTGLTANTTYYFNVIVKDESGNKAAYTMKSETTAPGTTYYVDNTNGSASNSNAGTNPSLPWLTIGKCASTIVAGDTCQVQTGGTYDERVTETTDGTSGSRITYQAQTGSPKPKVRGFTLSGDYITVDGFELTTSGMSSDSSWTVGISANTGNTISNNYIHDTTSYCIRLDNASFPIIRANTITLCGGPWTAPLTGGTVAILGGSGNPSTDVLIESNTISYVSDYLNPNGDKWVVRNNTVGPSDPQSDWHIDFIQPNSVTTNILSEGNLSIDNPGTGLLGEYNNHWILSEIEGNDHLIFRHNSTCRSIGFSIVTLADQYYFYNNTLYDNYATFSPSGNNMVAFNIDSTGNYSLNNIFYKSTRPSPSGINPYTTGAGSALTKDYDLWYLGGDPSETNDVNADPQVVDGAGCNFNLQSSSPAINAGGPLTTVAAADTGSGTSLVLTDAGFFQPGWAGVEADWIAVGTVGNVAQISSIATTTNTITLSSGITRNDGDSVWLYKDSEGTRVLYESAPDIGAFEFVPDTTAPVRSAGLPSGSQSAGTTQVTVSLTTDESATCKYGTTASTAYASIATNFSTTGGTSHSDTITDLANGQSYNYYVRCTDGSNANSDDYTISFSVASPAVSVSSGGGGSSAPYPTAPAGGFTVTASSTNSQNKTILNFGFGNDITSIAISENANFAPASYINATSAVEWIVPTTKILYTKYCNKYGRCSNPISVQINPYVPIVSNSYKFSRNLSYRMTGADVFELQKYLN